MPLNSDDTLDKMLSVLPLATYRAGEMILMAGSRSDRLLFLKKGEVVILDGSAEIARVRHPGAVIGEISALLDQPHTAEVRALTDSEFHFADATLVDKDPVVLRYVARILARRIVEANKNFVELRNQVGRSPSVVSKLLEKIQKILGVGGGDVKHVE